MKYYSYARLFVLLVLLDYIITVVLSVSLFVRLPAMLNTAASFLYLLLFVIFTSLLFYRFYNALFEKKFVFAISGLTMLFLGIFAMYLKRFVGVPVFQQIVFILFFISLIVLYFIILIPVIKSKHISDTERGAYIFLFLILTLPLINAVLKSVITSYPIMSIERYIGRLSSTSFLIFIFYYFVMVQSVVAKNNKVAKKNILITLALLVIIFLLSIYLKNENTYTTIIAIFNNINVKLYLPFYFYTFALAIFIITFIVGYIFTDNRFPFIPLTLVILTGLNTADFYIRIVSVFAVIDIAYYINTNKNINDFIEK